MTWIAPEVTRIDEPFVADERTMLEAWLDWHRGTLLHKCAGLPGELLARQSVPPSNLSLLGLVRHMAEVERSWFRRRFAGEPIDRLYCSDDSSDADIEDVAADRAEADYAAFVSELDLARKAAAGRSLDETFGHPRRPVPTNLRWVYNHMIEEYARHNGHADLIRECIDGTTGS